MRAFSDDIMAAAQKTSLELLEELASADPAYRSIYEPWKKFRDESYRWFSAAEATYARFSFR